MAAARRQHGDNIVLRGKVHRERIRALPAAEQPTAVMEHLGLQYTKGARPPSSLERHLSCLSRHRGQPPREGGAWAQA